MILGSRKGNLVVNGGFERGLTGWDGVCNVGLQSVAGAHQGLVAAAMGKPDNTLPASMFQEVPVVPGMVYRLELFVAGVDQAPADLTVDVRWLDRSGRDLGSALDPQGPVTVMSATIGAVTKGGYKDVVLYTSPAPVAASCATILLDKTPGSAQSNFLLVDDVMFFEVS